LLSSTTQITDRSRRGSRQIRHSSCSVTLPQTTQKRTFSLTSVSAEVSRRTSTGSAASRWKAMRCADFGPTPGSRPSSSMRSWTAPSYTYIPGRPSPPNPPASGPIFSTAAPARWRRVADRRDDEVLEALDVVGVDRLRVDLDADDLAGSR
jgi:hypothetical protein